MINKGTIKICNKNIGFDVIDFSNKIKIPSAFILALVSMIFKNPTALQVFFRFGVFYRTNNNIHNM